ncbi:MAG: Gx transporter family protein [Chitinispirillaceae bacterium]|nr:Gx transporter family protein [Chitinispirillaceae bacterium]
MQSYDNRQASVDTVTERAVWLLIAVALNTLELFIPRIPLLPWLKPGLANSITIIWIIRYGMADAVLYTLLRIWISSFYFGFSLVTISLALSGGVCATAVMGLLWQLLGKRGKLGTLGLAVAGAVAHNAGQLVAVYFLLTRNRVIWYQLPFMGLAALVFGILIGSIVQVLWRILIHDVSDSPLPVELQPKKYHPDHRFTPVNLLLLAVSAGLVFVHGFLPLGSCALTVTLLTFFIRNRNPSVFIHPLRLWPLFLFVALVYLFFSYGTRVPYIPFVTWEGLADTARQSLRLWTWLEIGLLLQRLQCNHLLFAILHRLFPRHADALLAGLLALEYFPEVVSFVRSSEARSDINWRDPFNGLAEFTGRVREYILQLLAGK